MSPRLVYSLLSPLSCSIFSAFCRKNRGDRRPTFLNDTREVEFFHRAIAQVEELSAVSFHATRSGLRERPLLDLIRRQVAEELPKARTPADELAEGASGWCSWTTQACHRQQSGGTRTAAAGRASQDHVWSSHIRRGATHGPADDGARDGQTSRSQSQRHLLPPAHTTSKPCAEISLCWQSVNRTEGSRLQSQGWLDHPSALRTTTAT